MKICYNCFSEMADSASICPRCGSRADLRNEDEFPHALPCGSVLNGNHIVGRVLGQGGFGITYVGQQFDTKEVVAIKEYFPGMLASRDGSRFVFPIKKDKIGDFEYGKKQFLDEARTLAAFIGSPNIVRVYSYFEENGTAYFVMENVRGRSLKQYVKSCGGRISWEETWDLLMPVLEALSEVHSKKIIHRDIKPDNIIITEEGRAKLIDFGAARYKHSEKSRSLTAILTPGYAPPEQYFSSGDQGAWTDVYGLAATMYFSITGKTPPESIEREHASNDSLQRPSSLGIDIPAYAEAALLKALSVKEKERFETTYDFRNAVLEGKHREEKKEGAKPAPSHRNDIFFRDTQKKAMAGDSSAQYLLGYLYETGMGVARNDKEAEKWYGMAAAQGNTDACMKLNRQPPRNGYDPGAGRDDSSAGRVSGQAGGPPPPGNIAAGRESQNWRKDGVVGRPPSPGNIAAGGGTDGGKKNPGTSKSGTRKKRGSGRFSGIVLALVLFSVIAAVVFVLSNRNKGGENEPEITTDKAVTTTTKAITTTSKDSAVTTTTKAITTTGKDSAVTTTTKAITTTTTEAPTTSTTKAQNTAPLHPEEDTKGKEDGQTIRTTDEPVELTDTWEEIAAAGRDGTYKERYRIGDTKELDMGSEGIITMKLAAMDEDELADGSGKAPMTWVADDLLRSEHNMNTERTNKGGWEASELRAWLRETVLPLMPEDVRKNIREVTKYSFSYEEQKGAASRDTIWIPSVREVFPGGYADYTDNRREKEGVSYTGVFTDDEARKRSRDSESGAARWWLRSASHDFSHAFCDVNSDGDSDSVRAYRERSVVIGFCL